MTLRKRSYLFEGEEKKWHEFIGDVGTFIDGMIGELKHLSRRRTSIGKKGGQSWEKGLEVLAKRMKGSSK